MSPGIGGPGGGGGRVFETTQALERWRSEVTLLELLLQESGLDPAALASPPSAASLRVLERFALERFGTPSPRSRVTIRTDAGDLRAAVAAAVGETLLAVGGGAWIWVVDVDPVDHPDGLPAVRADPRLRVDAVVPHILVTEALQAGDGERFAAVLLAWQHAADQVRQQDPSWSPTDPGGVGGAALQRWLSRCEAAFPDWVAAHAPDGRWDFSRASLGMLEETLRRVTPTSAELAAPSRRGFRDVAAWYLGEVLCRGLGGRWNLDPEEADEEDPVITVDDLGPFSAWTTPVPALDGALETPGFLALLYDNFAS